VRLQRQQTTKEEVRSSTQNPFASGLKCSYTADKYLHEELKSLHNKIETKLRYTSQTTNSIEKETNNTFNDDVKSVNS
jgi:hypothetical protein